MKYWMPSRRAARWAGFPVFCGLLIVAVVVYFISLALAEHYDSSSQEFSLVSAAICFGAPVLYVIISHIWLGVDAASQLREAQRQQGK